MRLRLLLTVLVFLLFVQLSVHAHTEMETDPFTVTRIDSLVEKSFTEKQIEQTVAIKKDSTGLNNIPQTQEFYKPKNIGQDRVYELIDIPRLLAEYEKNKTVTAKPMISDKFLRANPYFIDLKFYGYSSKSPEFKQWCVDDYFFEQQKSILIPAYFKPVSFSAAEKDIMSLRELTMRKTIAYQPYTIVYMVDELPDVTDLIQFKMISKPIDKTVIQMSRNSDYTQNKITVKTIKPTPWMLKSLANLQFSQNYVSSNWYQGGSNNISILGIVNGTFNYDNKKNIQWDNFAEWRLGFNSVEGDTMRLLNTNDDIIRATSKLGIKAGGNWFYSGSVDFSTQFFNSYKAVNSKDMKAKFLTPVRLNVGVGLDYKYQKLFSLMLSPLSYKFIYANDTVNVNKKSFGILPGEKVLSQIGSSFRAQVNYSPTREIQIDSKLSFYTNYEKVEIDWEIIGNFRVNRFLSTRLSLNPRYDNTVILAAGEKAKIQFKELLTFGLSYKLL
ncbi:MAG: DUF3078 domain-containing protein [Paludibacter sp.]|nr:DUF3078 domain-containing protein [Paludibacter sp.]